jgi:hypothetical protein
MSQNRDAPAYQEYAAAMMAQIPYRTMTLQDRGLFYSMRLECWVNVRLPQKPELLAKVLGFSEAEVRESLPAVMPFFSVSEGFLSCNELEDYRKHLEEKKEKAKRDGMRGAAITNSKPKRPKKRMDTSNDSIPSGTPTLTPSEDRQSPRQGQVGVLVKLSTVKPSQDQSLEKEVNADDWLTGYDSESNQAEASV